MPRLKKARHAESLTLTAPLLAAAILFTANCVRSKSATETFFLSCSPYDVSGGGYAVAVENEVVIRDETRGKYLPVRIFYPDARGRFPVIIFSHGAGGSKNGNDALAEYWASYGFVVFLPTHADSVSYKPRGERAPAMWDLLADIDTDSEGWANRARDISFVIDSLDDIERSVPEIAGKLAHTRIGVGGHSYGAFTAQLIGGATVTPPGTDKSVSYRDDRADAILLLSGQGSGQMGLTRESWKKVQVPMMSMTGSNDRALKGQPPEWRMEHFNLAPAGDKYFVFIDGAYHMSFTGKLAVSRLDFLRERLFTRLIDRSSEGWSGGSKEAPSEGWNQKEIFDCVKIESLAFWNAYLKGDPDAKEFLTSRGLERISEGAVKVSVK